MTVDPKDADIVYACNIDPVPLDRRRQDVRADQGRAGRRRLPLALDRSGRPAPHDRRRRPGRRRHASTAAKTWSSWYNQPTAQFYHVATDDRFPYWIYGAQQDSGAAATPSRTDYRVDHAARLATAIAAGGENGYIAPDPDGSRRSSSAARVSRFDWHDAAGAGRRSDARAIPGDYRGEWTLPLAISPRDPKALYFGNQFLFRTTDGGEHWEKISPDLTRETPGVPGEPRLRHDRGRAGERPAPRRDLRDRALAARPTDASGAAPTTA